MEQYISVVQQRVHYNVLLLIEFHRKFNRNVKSTEKYKGVALGNFYHNIKQGAVKLTDRDKEMLINNGIDISRTDRAKKKHEKIMLLVEFFEKMGRVPRQKEIYNGVKIGSFYHSIKSNNIKVEESDMKLLKELKIIT